jgi:hypothetical protein
VCFDFLHNFYLCNRLIKRFNVQAKEDGKGRGITEQKFPCTEERRKGGNGKKGLKVGTTGITDEHITDFLLSSQLNLVRMYFMYCGTNPRYATAVI